MSRLRIVEAGEHKGLLIAIERRDKAGQRVQVRCTSCQREDSVSLGHWQVSKYEKGCRKCKNDGSKSPNFKHGLTQTKAYHAWESMRQRCLNPDNDFYEHYGGRGIEICERWESFTNFLDDMGEPPGQSRSLDRIDNDGNYEPSNCRWATHQVQMKNRRRPAHCKHGHPYTPESTYTNPKTGWRRCRICQREYMRTYERDPA